MLKTVIWDWLFGPKFTTDDTLLGTKSRTANSCDVNVHSFGGTGTPQAAYARVYVRVSAKAATAFS